MPGGNKAMRSQNDQVPEMSCRTSLEDAVFDSLGAVYKLPPDQAIERAGFVAGQIASFLADMAKLSADGQVSHDARIALRELEANCQELRGLLGPVGAPTAQPPGACATVRQLFEDARITARGGDDGYASLRRGLPGGFGRA